MIDAKPGPCEIACLNSVDLKRKSGDVFGVRVGDASDSLTGPVKKKKRKNEDPSNFLTTSADLCAPSLERAPISLSFVTLSTTSLFTTEFLEDLQRLIRYAAVNVWRNNFLFVRFFFKFDKYYLKQQLRTANSGNDLTEMHAESQRFSIYQYNNDFPASSFTGCELVNELDGASNCDEILVRSDSLDSNLVRGARVLFKFLTSDWLSCSVFWSLANKISFNFVLLFLSSAQFLISIWLNCYNF